MYIEILCRNKLFFSALKTYYKSVFSNFNAKFGLKYYELILGGGNILSENKDKKCSVLL